MEYSESPEGQWELEQIEHDHIESQRERNEFIEAIVEVCKRFGVELSCDWEKLEASGVDMPEFCGDRVTTGYSWIVDVGDLERAIRMSK